MQVAALLSQDDVDVLASDEKGRTALHLAAMGGHVGVVNVLAKAGGLQLLLKTSHAGNTACACAAFEGQKEAEAELKRIQDAMTMAEAEREQLEYACWKLAEEKYQCEGKSNVLLTQEEYT